MHKGHRYFFEIQIPFPLDIHPELGLLGHMVDLFLIFEGGFLLFATVATPICTTTNSVHESPFLQGERFPSGETSSDACTEPLCWFLLSLSTRLTSITALEDTCGQEGEGTAEKAEAVGMRCRTHVGRGREAPPAPSAAAPQRALESADKGWCCFESLSEESS